MKSMYKKVCLFCFLGLLFSCADKTENIPAEMAEDPQEIVPVETEDDFVVQDVGEDENNNLGRRSVDENTQYESWGSRAFRIMGDERIEIEGINVEHTYINDYWHDYFILDEYNESRFESEKLGTYLFKDGKLIDIIPFGTTMESTGIIFSPDGKYIGLDSGTGVVRGMSFLSYPEYERIGRITYTAEGRIFWRENTVMYTTVGKDSIPGYPFENDSFLFIEEFNLETKQKNVLRNYTETESVSLHDFLYDTLVMTIMYVDKPEDWNEDYHLYKNRVELMPYQSAE